MVVAPAARRSMLVERPDRLELIVPAKRNFFVIMFLPASLAMWAYALVNVLRELFSGAKGPVPFLMFWLVGWTVGGGFALFVFLWMLAGRERISLQPKSWQSGARAIRFRADPRIRSAADSERSGFCSPVRSIQLDHHGPLLGSGRRPRCLRPRCQDHSPRRGRRRAGSGSNRQRAEETHTFPD